MIQNIDVNKLTPHPSNPRKDLGDLTELSDSIKANGVLQNLTIVPADIDDYKKMVSSKRAYKGKYTVVIGHRRLAAAKLAGLSELPCAVSEMDGKTQLATMLLENIQRNDLSLYEQAQGFQQLMLEFDETETGIAVMTGFSKSTVKRRLNLLNFDKDKFEKSVARGAKLEDFDKIAALKSKAARNACLNAVGTNSFEWEYRRALDAEKIESAKKKVFAELEKIAKPVPDSCYNYYEYDGYSNYNGFEIPKRLDGKEFYYCPKSSYVEFYLKKESETPAAKNVPEDTSKEDERRERHGKLKEIGDLACDMRIAFIGSFTDFKKRATAVTNFIAEIFKNAITTNLYIDEELFCEIMNIDEDDETALDNELKRLPEFFSLVAAYCAVEQQEYCQNYKGEYAGSSGLIRLYELLATIGYVMSDEEKAYVDGTHELYVKA